MLLKCRGQSGANRRRSSVTTSASAASRAVLVIARQASEGRISPSRSTFSPFARSVEPVEVMSTMMSAEPAAGAPSVAPRLSTMR